MKREELKALLLLLSPVIIIAILNIIGVIIGG